MNYLVDIVEEYNMDVSLGGFNINAFHDTLQNDITLQRFQMIRTKPMHFDGGVKRSCIFRKLFYKKSKHQV